MWKVLIGTVFLLSSCHSGTMVTSRIGTIPSGICTMDLNSWGKASQCSCVERQTYDERAGLCLNEGEPENVNIQGKIETGMMAIGGETTGVILTTYEGQSYELIVKMAEKEKLEKLSGQSFEVLGELIRIESVESIERRAIIVTSLNVLE